MKSMLLFCLLISDICLAQQVAFPLHAGDSWYYAFDLGSTINNRKTVVLADTVLSNGKQYSRISDPLFSPSIYFARQDSNKIFYLSPSLDSNEILRFEFNRNPKDTIFRVIDSVNPGLNKYLVIFKKSYIDTVFGQARKIYYFRFTMGDYFYEDDYIVDSIGIIGHEGGCINTCPPVQETLLGAVIQGRQYGTITDIQYSIIPLPQAFSLSQNYPNPFNPVTQLQFSIANLQFVTLKIYDIFGREVATLVNKELAPGRYTEQWNADGVASGVYVYQFQTRQINNGHTVGTLETKKMILLK